MKSILCVDDDELIQATISGYLKDEGYTVFNAYDEATAMAIVKKDHPNLILLDLVLEKTSGLDFLKNLKDDHADIPIIMISSRGEEIDRIIGLEAGADDYVAKPFHPRELSARIKSVLKRCEPHRPDLQSGEGRLIFDTWILDTQNYQVFSRPDGESANLTTKEFIVLKELIMNRNKVLPREQLFYLFRHYSDDIYDRVVDIQISRIRSKLGDDPRTPKYIKTIRDVGYTFVGNVTKGE